jgi:hypothetical protein
VKEIAGYKGNEQQQIDDNIYDNENESYLDNQGSVLNSKMVEYQTGYDNGNKADYEESKEKLKVFQKMPQLKKVQIPLPV